MSTEDLAVLREVLREVLGDLSVEIAGTDNRRFRDGLKSRREALRRVAEAVELARSAA